MSRRVDNGFQYTRFEGIKKLYTPQGIGLSYDTMEQYTDGVLRDKEGRVYWKDNHVTIYGPFNKQEDGFPNAGEVIRFYRKKMQLSQIKLALLLGVSRLQVINMENHNQVPQNLSRRRVIADLLKIPPVLLGVGVLGSYLEPLDNHPGAHPSIALYSMQEANEYLDAAWEVNFHTSAAYLLPGARKWEARIEEQVAHGGRGQEENLRLLHQYKHFLLMVGRERQDYSGADPVRFIDLARQIDDPDVLGISLFRRGKMYFEQRNYNAALIDVRYALSQREHTGPRVKGFTLVGSGPVLAHYATDKDDVGEVLDLLDEAEKCIDSAKDYPDPFHTGFDESWYFLTRASSMISLLQLDPSLINRVFEALELAQKHIKPYHTRRRASIEFRYANAAFHTGDYLSAVSTALEALELAQSSNLIHFTKAIQRLYGDLAQTKIKDSSELRKLRQALIRE